MNHYRFKDVTITLRYNNDKATIYWVAFKPKIMTEIIIDTLKEISGIDFTVKGRKTEPVQMRKIYYRLCKDLIKGISLNKIGSEVNRDHATVVASLKKFHEIEESYKYMNIYIKCLEMLSDNEEIKNPERYHDQKLLNLYAKFKYENRRLQAKVIALEKINKVIMDNKKFSSIIDKLDKLSDDKLREFEDNRLDPYIRMNVNN